MNPSLAIHIPEPCHEDWNKMTPKDNGSYCGSCEKTVVDFSKMNDDQIAQYVLEHPTEKMCGRFANTQLNRPLTSKILSKTGLKAFIYALVLVFGASLFAFTYSNNNNNTVGELMVNPIDTVTNNISLVADTLAVDTLTEDTTIDEEQFLTAGLMVADYDMPVEDTTLSIGTSIGNQNMMMGGVGMYTYIQDNIIPVETIRDSSSVLKKDSVNYEQLDKLAEPTIESYPNPTSGNVNIKYKIPQRTDVLIEIYDINGKKMMDLVSTSQLYEGTYIYPADLSELANGTYICRMVAGERSFSTKILVQK